MELNEFLILPTRELVQLVRESGPKVCVCPVNGTRRWYTLEHESGDSDYEDADSAYLDTVVKGYIDLIGLFFDQGIETILLPSFGPDLLERGDEYMQLAAAGFSHVTSHPWFLNFYEQYDVRVGFYGDYAKHFQNTDYQYLIEQFDEITQKTSGNKQRHLFWGLFANDASEAVAEFAVNYYRENQRTPNRKEIVEAYYGEYINPVDIFIGFDKFSTFDMPLISVGSEDLYFMVSPTLYLTQEQLRTILYDHLFLRRENDEEYSDKNESEWEEMRNFYDTHRGKTLGVGNKIGGIWYPSSQVEPSSNTKKVVRQE